MDQQRRIELHNLLKGILGSNNVYFQPPETLKISYPCIIYSRENVDSKYSDNVKYRNKVRYAVTYISRDPDSSVTDELLKIRYCSYDRYYSADNLHHDTFTIYY